ncbi:MAG: hypothetical protein V4692_02675 [Bdellovibrionota bacterium]
MEAEKKLADLVFGIDPLSSLEKETDPLFSVTNRKQFNLFRSRLVSRVEERLSHQFGACVALIEENQGTTPNSLATEFVQSNEYRHVREDVTDENGSSESRFEIGFLNFILRTRNENPELIEEFGAIFVHELAAGA